MTTLEIPPIALSIGAFCRTYSLGRTKAYALIAGGELVTKKVGGKTLIDSASANRWYNSLPDFSASPRVVKMRAAVKAATPQ